MTSGSTNSTMLFQIQDGPAYIVFSLYPKRSILQSGKSFRRKVPFFNSLGTTEISHILKLSIHVHVVHLGNFPEQSELRFLPQIFEKLWSFIICSIFLVRKLVSCFYKISLVTDFVVSVKVTKCLPLKTDCVMLRKHLFVMIICKKQSA